MIRCKYTAFIILFSLLFSSCINSSKIDNVEKHLLSLGYKKINENINFEEKVKNQTICENVANAPSEYSTKDFTIINYFKYSSEYDTCFIKTLELSLNNNQSHIYINDPLKDRAVMSTKIFQYSEIEEFWNNLN